MPVQLTRRRFTVAQYHQMGEAGILGEDDRVELIEGEITEMTPIGRAHAACVTRLDRLFQREFRDDASVRVQNPVTLDEHSEPQPDIALLRPRADYYASRDVTPADVLLLVEVCAGSAEPDRRVKVPLYARSGIAEVWLVDLQHENVTIYPEPFTVKYRSVRVAHRTERIAPAAFPERLLSVEDILG